MANSNNVSMKMIQEDYNKYKEIVNIDFQENVDGEMKDFTIKFHPYFEPSRIENVMENLRKDLDGIAENQKLDFPDKLLPLFLAYHSVIEFSNLPGSKSKDIARRVSYFHQMVNSKYFKMVAEHMLQEEFDKVWDMVLEILQANEKLERMINKQKDAIANLDIQNPEVYELVHGKANQALEH